MKVIFALLFGMFLQPVLAFECAADRPFSEQVTELKKMMTEKPKQVSDCSQALIDNASLALKYAERFQLKLVLIEALIRQSDFNGGLKLANQLLSDDAFSNNLELGVDLYRWLGVAYGRTGVNDKSIEAFQVMLAKATQLENEELIAAAENNLGATYLKMGDYPLALSYFQKVLNNVPPGWSDSRLAILHENIGVVFAWTEQHEEAVRAYQLALDSATKSKAATGLILTNMASSHMKLGHLDLAVQAINKALIDAEERSNRFVSALAMFIRAEIKLDNLEAEQALTDLRQSMQKKSEISVKLTVEDFSLLSRIYMAQGELTKAEQAAGQAIENIESKKDLKNASLAYEQLATVLNASGEKGAYAAQKTSMEKQQQLFATQLAVQLNDILQQERYKQQQSEISGLKLKAELDGLVLSQQLQKQQYLVSLGVALALILILISILYVIKRRSNLRLRQLNHELELALSKIKTMEGLIPICSQCKKIRDDDGFWNEVEVYVRDHSEVDFTHGYCPQCSDAIIKELEK